MTREDFLVGLLLEFLPDRKLGRILFRDGESGIHFESQCPERPLLCRERDFQRLLCFYARPLQVSFRQPNFRFSKIQAQLQKAKDRREAAERQAQEKVQVLKAKAAAAKAKVS